MPGFHHEYMCQKSASNSKLWNASITIRMGKNIDWKKDHCRMLQNQTTLVVQVSSQRQSTIDFV